MPYPSPPGRGLRFAAADFILSAAAYLAAWYLLVEVDPTVYLLYEGGLGCIAFTAGIIVIACYVQKLYLPEYLRGRTSVALALSTVIGTAFLAQAVLDYVHRDLAIPFPQMLVGTPIAFAALFGWRAVYLARRDSRPPEGVLLVGATEVMRRIGGRIAGAPELGMTVIGYIDGELKPGDPIEGGPVLGSLDALPEIFRRNPGRVVGDLASVEGQLPPAIVHRIMAAGVVVERPDRLYEELFGRLYVPQSTSSPLFVGDALAAAPARVAAQSVYNNLFALAALVACSPLILLIALLVKITSKGGVWDCRSVMGWNAIPFTLLRFRCTRVRRTADGASLEATRLGRWLRFLHLDGLPQLVNMLRGEMALVGPSPVSTPFANQLIESLPQHRLRYSVKPGILSWSRIWVEGNLDAAAELEYDLYYIKHLSLTLDCYVAMASMRAWLHRRRAAGPAPAARHAAAG